MIEPPLVEALWTPTLQAFQAYARLSGDDNPIHLDPAYAATHPFGRVVSHGMLIHAQITALAARHGLPLPTRAQITFPAPAYAEEELHLSLSPHTDGLSAKAARRDGTAVYEALWQSGDSHADR